MPIRKKKPARGKDDGWRKKEAINKIATRILAITDASLIKTNQITSPIATNNTKRKRYMIIFAQIVLERLVWLNCEFPRNFRPDT